MSPRLGEAASGLSPQRRAEAAPHGVPAQAGRDAFPMSRQRCRVDQEGGPGSLR